jgi:alkylation response protein AidB-like acyl-CoA dehydrogenase
MATAKQSASKSKLYGASFLVGITKPEEVFTPEDFTEEQHMIYEMVKDFCLKEIHGLGIERVALMDASKDMDTILEIFHKAAELGLCGVSIGNEYGGMDLDFTTGIIFSEVISLGFSFATTIGAQTSIGSLPIVYYGTEEQKQQYLPGIASGELKASYCLTEPGAGSDANSGKSNAVLNKEGTHYILNGQKMWITNGGFADIFIVFAKIDDDKDLSAFIVEKGFGGIELGKEEKKLGIKASSTVQVFFNNCPVPKENLLGDREGGFKMALNILNTGRIKLAAGSLGGVKFALEKSVEYATQRIQFEKPISEFGAMQQKIGQMATDAFAIESAVYRVAKNIEDKYRELKEAGSSENEAKINSIREYAIECAILKVVGSEAVGRATDEAIQIYGGMGYSMETGVEMGYRDARITRIYEGTNEINRMLSVGELMKRGFKTKEIDLMKASSGLPMDILRTTIPVRIGGGEFAQEEDIVNNIKNLFLVISAMAGRKLKLKLIDEQEIIINFADILAEAYIAESALLRVQKLTASASSDKEKLAAQKIMLQLYLYEALARAKKAGFDAINSYASGAERFLMRRVLDVLTRPYDVNPKELCRQVAQAAIKKGGYPS